MKYTVECLFSRGIREVTTVIRSGEDTVLAGAAQEKLFKAEISVIRAEKIEGLPATGEADTEPQLPENA